MTTALARRFKVDVSADGTTWFPFKGITDLNAPINPTKVDSSDYDTDGWKSYEITQQEWQVTIKANRPTTSGAFDAGQELVRAARGQFGDAARVWVRWYDRNGAPEAYKGKSIVEWNASKTGVADLDEVAVTLTGDGVLTSITNPYTSTALPVIFAITPAGKAAGQAVNIFGDNFTGLVATTGVKFGGTNATDFTLVNDGLITAVLPAGTAGATAVLVTTSVGVVATPFNYTRA